MTADQNKLNKILTLIVKVLYPKYHPVWFLFYMYIWYTRFQKRSKLYTIRPVSIENMVYIAKNRKFSMDLNTTVLVHPKNVYNTDNILKLFNNTSKSNIKVYVISSVVCDENKLLVSDCFYHNLLKLNLTDNVKLLKCNTSCEKFADEINLSLINPPFDVSNTLSDSLIERYFKIPRLLRKGDFIEINLKYFAEDMYYLNNNYKDISSLFYKCNKIIYNTIEVTDHRYCVIGDTAIRQGVNIQSFLPKKNIQFVFKENLYFQRLPVVPYGLQESFDQILKSVQPFLKKIKLQVHPVFLLKGKPGCGKEILISSLASHLGMHEYKIDNYDLMANVYAQNEVKLHNIFFNAKMAAPCIVSLQNFENFGKNNEGEYDERIMSHFVDELHFLFDNNPYPVLLICCSDQKTLQADLEKAFLETFIITAPNGLQRGQNLKWICEKQNIDIGCYLEEIVSKTHGFFFDDLEAMVYYAVQNSQINKTNICKDDFFKAIDNMQKNYNESIGAPKVPNVLWSDIGGLEDIKEELIKTINSSLKQLESSRKLGPKRSGILLYGPPGTGKTLIAKAVATECNLCFLSVKGPELLNMYVGQSEQNIREVFERAREALQCIIFFDELDALAPNRGFTGDSGGVMDRVVSQLLSEMDGLNESASIFIIGATNRPDLVDPALLRPGRFDKMLYIGPCTDEQSKISVLTALTRKFNLDKDIDLVKVVKVCPKNLTGADFYGICSNVWMSAVRRIISNIENGKISTDDATSDNVVVNFEDFKNSVRNLKPSLTEEDLLYFERLKS